MALTDGENGGIPATMLVSPSNGVNSGNNGFGGQDGWWVILLIILLACGGWGNNNNGYGNQPIIVNDGNNGVQRGFDQAAIMGGINGVQAGVNGLSTQICGCCGDVQAALCNGFAGVNATVNGGFANAETAATARQMANMQTAFNAQTAMSQGFNNLGTQLANYSSDNRLGTADLKYTIATENCADRYEAAQNTRDIIQSQTQGTQAILDKLCQLELDGVKNQLEQAQRENVGLQNQLNMATNREAIAAQNNLITQGFANEVDQLYNRLNNCPVPTTPVYGRTPIFTCNQNSCGCGNF